MQPERRRDLIRRRLFDLEKEAAKLYGELAGLHDEERLPGTYLVVEANGFSAVVPATALCEIVRLVEYSPLPNAPAHVLGVFIYRGTSVTAIDLASLLGARRAPPLSAHVLVLASSRPVALVVDKVTMLLESPQLAARPEDEDGARTRRLAVGLCAHGGKVYPILGVAPLVASLDEAA